MNLKDKILKKKGDPLPWNYDEILKHIGPFGKYQKRQFALLWFATFASGFAIVAFAFTGFVPEHRCQVSECEQGSVFSSNESTLMSKIVPEGEKCKRYFYETPERPTRVGEESAQLSCQELSRRIDGNDPNIKLKKCNTDDIIFDQSVVRNSVVTEYGLVCDYFYLRAIYNALMMGGMLAGSFIIGIISDQFGRLTGLMVAMAITVISGTAGAFMPTVQGYGFFRFFTGMGGLTMYITAFVIAVESSTPTYQAVIALLVGLGFPFGELGLALEAYFLRDWKTLQLVAHIPIVLIVLLWFFVPESTRWLIANGNRKKARKQIEEAARINGVNVPQHLMVESTSKEFQFNDNTSADKPPSLKDLFSNKVIFARFLNMMYQWFSVTMCFYGLLFTATSLSGDPYTNFAISCISDVVGVCLAYFLNEGWGRRPVLSVLQTFSGICVIGAGMLLGNKVLALLQIALFMIGKIFAISAFWSVYIYTNELFPTRIRGTAIGTCSTAGRVGGVISLLLASLKKFWVPAPMIIMGSVAIIAGTAAFKFPETVGNRLPDTIEDAVNIGKTKRRGLCSFALHCCKFTIEA